MLVASTSAFLLALLCIYSPDNWQFYPSMDEIRCISTSTRHVYIAAPRGVYVLKRSGYEHVRTLTAADGIDRNEEIKLCAHNPARGDLLIVTTARLYGYLEETDRMTEYFPPFREIRSIGTAADGAYFDTEQGIFHKQPLTPDFKRVGSLPSDVTWYGERDTLEPDDFSFLSPYYLVDEQLQIRPMTLVRAGFRERKLYVAAQDYGVKIYDMRSGFTDRHIRIGPPSQPVSRIISLDRRLWFLAQDRTVALDSDGEWLHRRTMTGDLPSFEFRLLFGNVLDLRRREGLNAALADSPLLYLATDKGLYSLGSDDKLVNVLQTSASVNALARLGDSILFGTSSGLFALHNGNVHEVRDPFERTGFGVYAMARSGGHTWLGTFGGILHLGPDGTWEHLIPPGFDLSRYVSGLAASGDLVFYESGDGITAWNAKDSIRYLVRPDDGLPSEQVTSLWADDRYLWIASPGMVSRLDYRAKFNLGRDD